MDWWVVAVRTTIILVLLSVSTLSLAQTQDWLQHNRSLDFWVRLAEIESVSEQSEAVQRQRIPALIHLLKDENQSVRIVAAKEIAELNEIAARALPKLIESFRQPNGEEGMEYVLAVVVFGNQALPELQPALESALTPSFQHK